MRITTTADITGQPTGLRLVGCFEQGGSAEWLGPVEADRYGDPRPYDDNFAFVLRYDGADDDEEEGSFASTKIVRPSKQAWKSWRDYLSHFSDLAWKRTTPRPTICCSSASSSAKSSTGAI